MKKFLQRLSVLVMASFVVYAVVSAVSFAAFYISLAETNTDACTRYYSGISKGTIWDRGEWHHYVDFEVGNLPPHKNWKVVDAPLPSSIWRGSSSSFDTSLGTIRFSYRWPSNWYDPFPVSAWKICLLGS
jgi:hypothetical protein